jgi:hypothetical protein
MCFVRGTAQRLTVAKMGAEEFDLAVERVYDLDTLSNDELLTLYK